MNTMMISSQETKVLVDTFKLFKADKVFIAYGGVCYGTNTSFSYMKCMVSNSEFLNSMMQLCYDTELTNSTICNKYLHHIEYDVYGNLYVYMTGESECVFIRNMMLPPVAYERFTQCVYMMNVTPVSTYTDITEDIIIQECMSSVTKDGVFMYYKDKYIMTIYKGLLPITKSDKVELRIYEDPNMPLQFTARYSVIKKKSVTIDIFLAYKYLQ